MSVHERVYKLLGRYDGYYVNPPMEHRKKYYSKDHLIKFTNDGLDVSIGSSSEWYVSLTHREFRRITLWYLWQWVVVDWFGLRSKLWYRMLRKKIKKDDDARAGRPS